MRGIIGTIIVFLAAVMAREIGTSTIAAVLIGLVAGIIWGAICEAHNVQ